MTSQGRRDFSPRSSSEANSASTRARLDFLHGIARIEAMLGEELDLVVRVFDVPVASGEELFPAGNGIVLRLAGGASVFIGTGGSSILSRSEPGIGFR